MHTPAREPNDLEKYFVERANEGDVEGLVVLYEPNAVVVPGEAMLLVGTDQIRAFFVEYVRDRPQLEPSDQAPAVISGDIAFTSSRHSNGDISAEIARKQPNGNWLWVVDQFAIGS